MPPLAILNNIIFIIRRDGMTGMKQRISNVEAGRGLAAVLVVLYHADKYYFGAPKYWHHDAFGGVFGFGHAGVEFFFVLSGFIMLLVHRQDIGQSHRVFPFIQRRFERIYPFFWVVLAVTVASYLLSPATGEAIYRDPANLIQSALLIGREPLDSPVFVSWTLWHEVLFYALCALVIGIPKLGIPAFVGWTVACLIVPLFGFETPWPIYMTGFINILFSFGVVCSLLLSSTSIPWPRAFMIAGLALFFATGLLSVSTTLLPEGIARVSFGFGSVLFLLGAVEAERSDIYRVPSWAALVGQASYSIYLVHIPALTIEAKLAAKLHLTTTIPWWLAFLAIVAGAVLVGIAAHLMIERPLIAFVRGQFAARRNTAVQS
jgi:peptidoglycan/LPS O-acetylase OafA/YrhL